MVHLRIVVPAERSAQVVELLGASDAACNLVLLPGAALKPAGDVVLCDIAREEASVLIADLKELGVHRDGSITLELVDSQISMAADRAEKAAPGGPADAVVWEEVEARTSESTELGGNLLAFMVIACLLASIGIFLSSPILIVGAMVVGPEFGPLAALSVALVNRRLDLARRSVLALAVGFPVGITAAFLFSLLAKATGLVDTGFSSGQQELTHFIANPDTFSLLVAVLGGAAGVLSLTSAKSGALIGVLISVTTIPAAANIGIAAAFGDWSEWRGAMTQLAVNLVAICLAGVVTLAIERLIYRRRRKRHLGDGHGARAAAGMPERGSR
jgi:uncharacterized hydrophobic protein (TIGR00271 family)